MDISGTMAPRSSSNESQHSQILFALMQMLTAVRTAVLCCAVLADCAWLQCLAARLLCTWPDERAHRWPAPLKWRCRDWSYEVAAVCRTVLCRDWSYEVAAVCRTVLCRDWSYEVAAVCRTVLCHVAAGLVTSGRNWTYERA